MTVEIPQTWLMGRKRRSPVSESLRSRKRGPDQRGPKQQAYAHSDPQVGVREAVVRHGTLSVSGRGMGIAHSYTYVKTIGLAKVRSSVNPMLTIVWQR